MGPAALCLHLIETDARHKASDFTIPEFDFTAYANAANNVGVLNLPPS